MMKRLLQSRREKVETESLLLPQRIDIKNLFFYLLILFLPTQFGRHFWPTFSLVSGIRIDYLSPTLYLTDILVLLLFVAWILKKKFSIFNFQFSIKSKFKNLKIKNSFQISNFKFQIALIILVVIIGIIFSKNPLVGLYGWLKFFEFIFLGFYTAHNFKKLRLNTVLLLFSIGIIFESFLSVAQYLNQGSIGGIFYFFGERTFNGQTPGIANASISGALVLRPYGTFSHPNVLAGYLTIAMAMVSLKFKVLASLRSGQSSKFRNIATVASVILGTAALFLTMSRIAILLWLIIVVIQGTSYVSKNIRLLVVLVFIGSIGSILLLSPLRFRFSDIRLSEESIVQRGELMKDSFSMIKSNPSFGVGLNNFLVELPKVHMKNDNVFYLQPVHNIYLLILSQTGIVGFAFFLWFIGKTYQKLKTQNSKLKTASDAVKTTSKNLKSEKKNKLVIGNWSLVISLSSILTLGFFDHYFLTLQQGQLLFSFILGLCWARPSKRNA